MSEIPPGGHRVTLIVESADGHYTEIRRVGQLGVRMLLAMCISAMDDSRPTDKLGDMAYAAYDAANKID